jgi:hypothetical protein
MSDPKFTDPPETPVRGSASFSSQVASFLAWLTLYVGQLRTTVSWIRSRVTDVTNSTTSAATSQAGALAAKIGAEAARDDALSASDAPLWTDKTYAVGNAVISPLDFKIYRDKTGGVSAIDPSLDRVRWASIEVATLASIAQVKGLTMVDGCIDTSPNPPLAVQRRTRWFAELGPLPARKVIIATLSEVTIYNGDDPSCPDWATFPIGSGVQGSRWQRTANNSGVKMVNGVMTVARADGSDGLLIVNFGRGVGKRVRNSAQSGTTTSQEWDITTRASANPPYTNTYTTPEIINSVVKSVAMHVPADAPIDPQTGMQIPTIAVGTVGGVTIIHGDETVTHSLSTLGIANVVFDADGGLYASRDNFGSHMIYASAEDYKSGGFGVAVGLNTATPSAVAMLAGAIRTNALAVGPDHVALAGRDASQSSRYGLMLMAPVKHDFGASMTAFITSKYNTGWMPKGIIGAYLSSTDATSLVGEEFISGTSHPLDGSYVVRGTLADAGGGYWTVAGNDPSNPAVIASADGKLVIGQEYEVILEVSAASGGTVSLYQSLTENSGLSLPAMFSGLGVGIYKTTFTASRDTLTLVAGGNGTSVTLKVSLRRAEFDRYLGTKSLTVKGTIQRSPVATGAELTRYHGGFDATNHLHGFIEDFNEKSFYLAMWFLGYGGSKLLMGTGDLGTLSKGRALYINGAGMLVASGWSNDVSSEMIVLGGQWHLGVAQWEYLGGTDYNVSIAVDGKIRGAGSKSLLNFTDKELRIGYHPTPPSNGTGCEMALARVGLGTIPPEQIAKMYRDELPLFQPNSKAALHGASDGVNAVGHDQKTGLLHAGTSAGRSDFSGLVRVGQTDTPITTNIVAHDGMILEA